MLRPLMASAKAGSEDIDDNGDDESGNESEGENDVDEDAENIVSDVDSINSSDHSVVSGGSDVSDADGNDDGDFETAPYGLLDSDSQAGVDGRKTGVADS